MVANFLVKQINTVIKTKDVVGFLLFQKHLSFACLQRVRMNQNHDWYSSFSYSGSQHQSLQLNWSFHDQ